MIKSVILFTILFHTSANAYIGPGMGVGAMLGILAVIFVILLTLIAIVYYPIKNLLKKVLSKKKDNQNWFILI